MGNEHSKNKELTKNGKIPEKHENGAVNGISANITSNGLEIGVNGETIIQQNAMSTSSNPATESNEQYVIVESNCQHVDAQVISDTPDTTVQKEEEEKKRETSNEDQTDASLPATNPQTESDSSGEEAAATIIVVHQEEFECPHQTAEISTQTDVKTEADISTQTSDDRDSTTYTGSPIEEVAVMETATTEEHSLSESVVVIAEEVVEDTTYEEPLDNQTAGIIITEEVNIENNVYENIVFIAERVEVTDNFEISQIKNYNPEEESINGPEEIEQEITKEPESNPNKSIIVDEISAEENVIEENVPLEVSFSLPKVVADCIEAVFSSVSESSDYTAVNTSEPRVEEVITEDNGERAGDMSADAVLIETAEPEPNAVTPEAGEANGVQSLDAEPVTKVIETIFEVIYEEPNATPGDQDMPVKEPSVPLETEILVKMESAHEEVAADDAVAVEDVPEKLSPVSDDEPSKSENQIITIEELPEVSLMSPDDEIQIELQSIPEIIVTEVDVNEDVIADVAPETVEESEVSFAIVKEDAEVLLEAAIDALCLELEPSAITPLESAADNTSPLEEEVFVATFFVPLSAEQEASFTIPEEPVEETIIPSKDEIVAEKMKEEAIQALLNEFKAVPQSVNKDTAVQETSTEGEVAILEETVEESDMAEEKAEVSDDEPPTEFTEEPVEETIIPSKDEIVAEEMKKEAIQALSNEFEAVPQSVNKDIAVQETSTEGEVAILEQSVEENNVIEEKIEVSEDEPLTKVTEEPVEETIIPSKDEIVAEEMKKEAIQALSNEFEAVPRSVNKDTAVQETSTEGEITILAELVEESDVIGEKVEVSEDKPPTKVTEEPVEETIIPSEDEIVAEEMNKEAIQALSSEFKAVPQSVNKDTAVQETSTEGEITILAELVEESDVAEEKAEVSDEEPPTKVTEEPVEETIIPSEDEIVAEEMNKEAIQALSSEFKAVPQSVNKDTAVQETSTEGEVAISEDPVEENDVTEEKIEVSEDELPTEVTEEPVEETIIPSKDETVAEEMKDEAIQALSNEFEAVPQSVDEDIAVQETSTEGEVAILEEPMEESDVAEEKTEDEPLTEATEEPEEPREENVAAAEVLLEDADEERVTPSVVALEILESSPVISEEALEESVSSLEQLPKGGVRVVILKTTEDFTEEIIHETDHSRDVSAAVADNTEDSQVAALDESVVACIEAIVEKIITEDVVEAERNPVTSEDVASEIITEAEQKAEDESSVNTTVPSPNHWENMEAVLVKLQLACASVVEESAYKLSGLVISSQGYSIYVTIHVAPKMKQQ